MIMMIILHFHQRLYYSFGPYSAFIINASFFRLISVFYYC